MTMIIMKAMAMMIMVIISTIISLPTAREWGIVFGGELTGSEGKVCKRGNNTCNIFRVRRVGFFNFGSGSGIGKIFWVGSGLGYRVFVSNTKSIGY